MLRRCLLEIEGALLTGEPALVRRSVRRFVSGEERRAVYDPLLGVAVKRLVGLPKRSLIFTRNDEGWGKRT
jgi:hypothetical protein